MSEIDFERRLEELLAGYADRPIETGPAWRRFVVRRHAAAERVRRMVAVTAVGAVAVAAVAVPYVLRQGGGDVRSAPASSQHGLAIAARIGIPGPGRHGPGDSGIAGEVIGQHGQVWVITYDGDLIRVDPRSNEVTLRKHVTGLTDLAVGAGTLWALVAQKVSGGHLLKLDPVTLRVLASFKVPRTCRAISFGGGQLWAACGGELTRFLRIDTSTGHVLARSGLASSVSSIAATADGIWYAEGNTGVSGYVETGSRLTWVRASDAADLAFTDSLVYANGSLWAFYNGENVARINPATGRITKIYSANRYDPTGDLSLNWFAVDQNSIWFLRDASYRATAVLRVSLATGRPVGQVSGVGSCGEPCWQIYVAQGSAWVPTQENLVRISLATPPRRTASR